MPPILASIENDFENYYKNRHQGKKISFTPALSTSLVFAHFKPKADGTYAKEFQLEVSGLQAIVLYCFNEGEQLSYEQLQAMTKLDERNLNQQLISLACMEYKILSVVKQQKPEEEEKKGIDTTAVKPSKQKKPGEKKTIKKTISKEDSFTVNDKFICKMKRIVINSIQRKETTADSKNVANRVIADRKFFIDAAVVKTMKARKIVRHSDLILEVIRLVRFSLEIDTLK